MSATFHCNRAKKLKHGAEICGSQPVLPLFARQTSVQAFLYCHLQCDISKNVLKHHVLWLAERTSRNAGTESILCT
jgi:hypothetical protein